MKTTKKLSICAKAELLGSVLHVLEEDVQVWKELPASYRKMIKAAQRSCSVWHEDLTKKDIKNIHEWFEEVSK